MGNVCLCVQSNGRVARPQEDELGKAVPLCYCLLAARRLGNHL